MHWSCIFYFLSNFLKYIKASIILYNLGIDIFFYTFPIGRFYVLYIKMFLHMCWLYLIQLVKWSINIVLKFELWIPLNFSFIEATTLNVYMKKEMKHQNKTSYLLIRNSIFLRHLLMIKSSNMLWCPTQQKGLLYTIPSSYKPSKQEVLALQPNVRT